MRIQLPNATPTPGGMGATGGGQRRGNRPMPTQAFAQGVQAVGGPMPQLMPQQAPRPFPAAPGAGASGGFSAYGGGMVNAQAAGDTMPQDDQPWQMSAINPNRSLTGQQIMPGDSGQTRQAQNWTMNAGQAYDQFTFQPWRGMTPPQYQREQDMLMGAQGQMQGAGYDWSGANQQYNAAQGALDANFANAGRQYAAGQAALDQGRAGATGRFLQGLGALQSGQTNASGQYQQGLGSLQQGTAAGRSQFQAGLGALQFGQTNANAQLSQGLGALQQGNQQANNQWGTAAQMLGQGARTAEQAGQRATERYDQLFDRAMGGLTVSGGAAARADMDGLQQRVDAAANTLERGRQTASDRYGALFGVAGEGFGVSSGGAASANTARLNQELDAALEGLRGPDRAALAAESLKLMEERSQPGFERSLREVAARNAAMGRRGSGITTNELGDVTLARERELGLARRDLANQASGQTLADRLAVSQAQQGIAQQRFGGEQFNAQLADSAAGRAMQASMASANNRLQALGLQRGLAGDDYAMQRDQASQGMEGANLLASQSRFNAGMEDSAAGRELSASTATANNRLRGLDFQRGLLGDQYGIGRDAFGMARDQSQLAMEQGDRARTAGLDEAGFRQGMSDRARQAGLDEAGFRQGFGEFSRQTGLDEAGFQQGLGDRSRQAGLDMAGFQREFGNLARQQGLDDAGFRTTVGDRMAQQGNDLANFAMGRGDRLAGQTRDNTGLRERQAGFTRSIASDLAGLTRDSYGAARDERDAARRDEFDRFGATRNRFGDFQNFLGNERQNDANRRQEARGERSWQYGLQRDAIGDEFTRANFEEQLRNNRFNRAGGYAGMGFGQSPMGAYQNQGQYYGQQANDWYTLAGEAANYMGQRGRRSGASGGQRP